MGNKYPVGLTMRDPKIARKQVRACRPKSDLVIEDRIVEEIKSKSSGDDKICKDMFASMLDAVDIKYKRNINIQNIDFDFEIIDKNILINICNTSTHNCLFGYDGLGYGVSVKDHKDAYNAATDNKFKYIELFDWDHPEVIINNILNIEDSNEGSHVEVIPQIVFKQFLQMHDIDTDTCKKKYTYLYGTYDVSENLIAVGAFSGLNKPRYDWRLVKYCETSIIWHEQNLVMMINKFLEDHKGKNIVTFLDLSKYNVGSISALERSGFKFEKWQYPDKLWSRGVDMMSSILVRGRSYQEIFNESIASGTCIHTQFVENGWLPIYDCGKSRYLYERD